MDRNRFDASHIKIAAHSIFLAKICFHSEKWMKEKVRREIKINFSFSLHFKVRKTFVISFICLLTIYVADMEERFGCVSIKKRVAHECKDANAATRAIVWFVMNIDLITSPESEGHHQLTLRRCEEWRGEEEVGELNWTKQSVDNKASHCWTCSWSSYVEILTNLDHSIRRVGEQKRTENKISLYVGRLSIRNSSDDSIHASSSLVLSELCGTSSRS